LFKEFDRLKIETYLAENGKFLISKVVTALEECNDENTIENLNEILYASKKLLDGNSEYNEYDKISALEEGKSVLSVLDSYTKDSKNKLKNKLESIFKTFDKQVNYYYNNILGYETKFNKLKEENIDPDFLVDKLYFSNSFKYNSYDQILPLIIYSGGFSVKHFSETISNLQDTDIDIKSFEVFLKDGRGYKYNNIIEGLIPTENKYLLGITSKNLIFVTDKIEFKNYNNLTVSDYLPLRGSLNREHLKYDKILKILSEFKQTLSKYNSYKSKIFNIVDTTIIDLDLNDIKGSKNDYNLYLDFIKYEVLTKLTLMSSVDSVFRIMVSELNYKSDIKRFKTKLV